MSKPRIHADEEDDQAPQRPIELSEEAAELVRSLETERDQAVAARQRALADFANFQKRAAENERWALQAGAARLAKSILPVLDHFDLALNQDPRQVTVEQLIGGVRIVRDELAKVLQANGVERIEPRPDDEFDPNRHEAMMRQAGPAHVRPGRVVAVLQPGYAMGDQVLRPAKVAIAPDSPSDTAGASVSEEHAAGPANAPAATEREREE